MKNFKINHHNNMVYLSVPEFDDTGIVKTAFTTRVKGVSEGGYKSLNLGEKTNDFAVNINNNYEILMETLELKKLVALDQIHSDKIIEITKANLEPELKRIKAGEGDALVTNEKNTAIMTVHADCIPIFFLDTENKAIALAHSGWKGTLSNIAAKTFLKMQQLYGSNASSVKVAIGPGIDICCFETGKEVYDSLIEEFKYVENYSEKKQNDKYMINLKAIIKKQLEEIGLKDIIISSDCTMCNKKLFFSHRRDKGITGRMAAIIQLI